LGFASPASDLLAQEEVTTTKVINLIQGKGQLADATSGFTPQLQKNFNATALAGAQKGVAAQFGKMSNVQLVQLNKFPNADQLIYIAKAQKTPNVQMIFVFATNGKKALLNNFAAGPLEVKQVPAQNQAASK
ncbi:hypothetical protein, partial [uncultured Acidaminococcus sp.]|uniref:hypothetical protein n=1 Tax=uncultured Acidaminococcus sp. TaxID=352152 RepID=UPI002597997A